jgi:hypothetical protein
MILSNAKNGDNEQGHREANLMNSMISRFLLGL